MDDQINSNPKPNYLYAVLASAVGTVVFATLLIAVSYLWPASQEWLKQTFSHHWIGKSVLAAGFFFASLIVNLIIRPQTSDEKIVRMLWNLFWFALAGSVIIFALNLYETFLAFG